LPECLRGKYMFTIKYREGVEEPVSSFFESLDIETMQKSEGSFVLGLASFTSNGTERSAVFKEYKFACGSEGEARKWVHCIRWATLRFSL